MTLPVRFHLSAHVSLSASAGSGKTYALTHRLLRMLAFGVDPEQILCTTFTNKATNEMTERLMRDLNRLAGDEPFAELSAEEAAEIAELITGGEASPRRVQSAARETRSRLLSHYSRLTVSTMDSFFNAILRLFPFEARVQPDFRMMNEREEEEVFRLALNELMATVLSCENDAELLNSLLLSLSQTETSPENLLGRFFTDLLPHRVNILRHIKSLPVAEGSAASVQARAEAESAAAREVVEASRAFAEAMDQHAGPLGPRAAETVGKCRTASSALDVSGLTPFHKEHYRDYSFFRKVPESEQITSAFDHTRRSLEAHVRAKSLFAVSALLYFFRSYVQRADQIKHRRRQLSFSDVERLCFELMVGYDEVAPDAFAGGTDYFYYRIDGRVKHLLMDEFQDTNILQWEIFRPIIFEITADREGSFFYVGDPKQAIYRFRGGESRLFHHVRSVLKSRGIRSDELPMNYRSARGIVSFVNTAFQYIAQHEGYDFSPQDAFRDDEGYSEIAAVPRGPKENPEGPLYEALSRKILEIRKAGVDYRDMAVLLVDNKTCLEVTDYLESVNIPAAAEKKLALVETPSARTVLALLYYLSDSSDDLRLSEFVAQAWKHRPLGELRHILQAGPGQRKLNLRNLPGDAETTLEGLRYLADLVPIRELVVRIIRSFSLGRVFEDGGDLTRLVELAGKFPDGRGAAGLRSFLSAVERYGQAVPVAPESEPDAVQVLTVHKSKGLEYRAVFLPQTDETFAFNKKKSNFMMPLGERFEFRGIHLTPSRNELPFAGPLADIYAEEAEGARIDALNLLYVALTRARDALVVLGFSETLRKGNNRRSGSWFPLLNRALCPDAELPSSHAERVLHRRGSLIPARQPEPARTATETGEKTVGLEPFEMKGTGHGESELGIEEAAAGVGDPASMNDGKASESLRDASFSMARVAARIYGEAFHYAIERFALGAAPEHALASAVQRYGTVLGATGREALKKDLEAIRKHPRLGPWFSSARILPELPFTLRDGTGRKADAIVFSEDRITVIDYKTSLNREYVAEYREQVTEYMGLIRECFPGRNVSGCLVFVEKGQVTMEAVDT